MMAPKLKLVTTSILFNIALEILVKLHFGETHFCYNNMKIPNYISMKSYTWLIYGIPFPSIAYYSGWYATYWQSYQYKMFLVSNIQPIFASTILLIKKWRPWNFCLHISIVATCKANYLDLSFGANYSQSWYYKFHNDN